MPLKGEELLRSRRFLGPKGVKPYPEYELKWTDEDMVRYVDLARTVGVAEAQRVIARTKAFRKKNAK